MSWLCIFLSHRFMKYITCYLKINSFHVFIQHFLNTGIYQLLCPLANGSWTGKTGIHTSNHFLININCNCTHKLVYCCFNMQKYNLF